MELAEHADEVSPHLWVSAMPEPSWPLVPWGIGLLVSTSDHLPPQAARRIEWGTRGGAVGEGNLVYLHWPIEDGMLPNLQAGSAVVAMVVFALQGGTKVLVHCQEGRNRSGLIAALAIREIHQCSGQEALMQVRARRPGMLSNRRFASYLESLPAPGQDRAATGTSEN